jgi:hypothetical protein
LTLFRFTYYIANVSSGLKRYGVGSGQDQEL